MHHGRRPQSTYLALANRAQPTGATTMPIPRGPRQRTAVTRYTFDDILGTGEPETGHTSLLPGDDLTVTVPMDNGWTDTAQVGYLPDHDGPVVVDMDPVVDPVLL